MVNVQNHSHQIVIIGGRTVGVTVANQLSLKSPGLDIAIIEPSSETAQGKKIKYEILIVCPGIQIDWHLIEGLPEILGRNGVTSNYAKYCAPYTWELIQNFRGGTAIFTYPATPLKCGGAPQKIMYLADDIFQQKSGVGTQTKVMFCTAATKMFTVPEYAQVLEQVIQRRNP